jgi:hypothetical protein
MADPAALLEAHRPLLRYDSQDPYRACSALTIVENAGNRLLDGRGRAIAEAGGGDGAIALDSLRAGDDRSGERLDEGGNERRILRDALRMQTADRYRDRTYARALQYGDTTYLQYWFWLYYNPKDLVGRGRHEGDWEMIQIRVEGERPVCAVYAQHDHASKLEWESVRRHPGGDGPHPVVYVAAESHASYFEDGTHPAFGRADNAYGDGPESMPGMEEFGDWAEWPGRWGNSTGILSWLPAFLWKPPAGRSPEGPGRQRTKWVDPAAFERKARHAKDKETRLLWRLGRETYPLEPEIVDARLAGDRVVVRYRTRNKFLRRRARHLLVTVHAPDARGDLLGRRSLVNAPHEGEVEVELVRSPDRAVVLVSAFNRRRQRSVVATRELTP